MPTCEGLEDVVSPRTQEEETMVLVSMAAWSLWGEVVCAGTCRRKLQAQNGITWAKAHDTIDTETSKPVENFYEFIWVKLTTISEK